MNYFFSSRLVNTALRALTLGLKFLLSLIVIKKLDIEDYGILGLFQSTIIIMTFVIGFDFYSFNTREMMKQEARELGFYLKNQLLFHIFVYLVFIPISFFIFKIGILPFEHLSLFYFILISEHMSQELYRILIILNKTVPATVILFLRSGVWIVLLYIAWEFDWINSSINSLLLFWLFGAVISLVYGFMYIEFKWVKGIDIKWIIKGLRIAFPFFIGTIMYKLIEFSGRYFLNFYFTETEVGVFSFFSGVANTLFIFVQTVVIIEIYPKLLESKNHSLNNFFATLKIFAKQIKLYTIFGLLMSILLIYPLLILLDKEVLYEHIFSYLILLISSCFFCFSFTYHYALYTHSQDISLLKATCLSFLSNIIFSILLIPTYGILGAAISQLGSFLVMISAKYFYWKTHTNNL